MGMVASFAPINRETFDRLQHDPGLMEEYLYPNDGEDEPPGCIDVDKAWHGIHYLLTGQAEGGKEPLSLAVLGGQELGEDVGYGPARVLTPEQVSQISAALGPLSDAALASRFDPQAMEKLDIYPQAIWVCDEKQALEYVLTNYHAMREFYAEAARRHDGAVLWLC